MEKSDSQPGSSELPPQAISIVLEKSLSASLLLQRDSKTWMQATATQLYLCVECPSQYMPKVISGTYSHDSNTPYFFGYTKSPCQDKSASQGLTDTDKVKGSY